MNESINGAVEEISEKLAKRFFKQKEEKIIEGLQDLIKSGRLVVEEYPIKTKTEDVPDGLKVIQEQALRVVVKPHGTCSDCVNKGNWGECPIDDVIIEDYWAKKDFYCAEWRNKDE